MLFNLSVLVGGEGAVVVVLPDMQPITLEIPRALMDSTMILVPSDIMVVGPGEWRHRAKQGGLGSHDQVTAIRVSGEMANASPDLDNAEAQRQLNNNNRPISSGLWDTECTSSKLFECSRIRALADERDAVQKKTFTKWVNSHLSRVSCRIADLYNDLRDGYMLTRLLEVLSGELLPRPTRGRMRIHCLENVDKALQFLKEQRVHLENVGSHDIVDGNHRLTLGLIWTIILRFQIQVIKIETEDNRETRSAKDALLLWCQMKTAGYSEVNIQNFTTCWRDGLAFNALIHRHRPDLIEFNKLTRSNATHNLQQAFNIAEQSLGLTKLLDPEDVNTENPDEKSIITYVVSYYHYFSKMKALIVEGKRVGKVLENCVEAEKIVNRYEGLASDLLDWIEKTIAVISNQKFANSLTGVQQQLQAFTTYCTIEKPIKFQEKGNLEVLLFTIQSKLRANNQKPYVPHDGKLISDINKAWERLEKAEHERGVALRKELIRQEKLELLAQRFDHKTTMRQAWLNENQRLVSQDNFGYDLPAVEAAMKKHEAIEADIASYEDRIGVVVELAGEMEAEGYYDIRRILARKENILGQWGLLKELVVGRKARLEQNLALQKTFQDMVYMIDWMEDTQDDLKAWVGNITASITEHDEIARWGQPQPTTSSTDEGTRPDGSKGDNRSERADNRSEKGGENRSEKGGENRSERGGERSDRGDRDMQAPGAVPAPPVAVWGDNSRFKS
ncbi:spectrin beta chain, non-erythrocytic 1-like [Gadus chalcogrammus]|uniref:spectrin beta chain, non-erythrocytic 1-like n=1 Tax=Gadus chalcogrammus TaxID=1042646 RepID=UPI0024C47E28|nr:spectrin beta chain, non-erythrocytic 1-like [Gadus chalcogrammus]